MSIEQSLQAPPHFPDAVIVRKGECLRLSICTETGHATLAVEDVRGMAGAGAATPIEVHDGRVREIDLTRRPDLDSGECQVFRISEAEALAEDKLPDAGEAGDEHLEEMDGVAVWEADSWFGSLSSEEQRRFAAKSDEALIEEAAGDDVILEGLVEWRGSVAQANRPQSRRSGMRP